MVELVAVELLHNMLGLYGDDLGALKHPPWCLDGSNCDDHAGLIKFSPTFLGAPLIVPCPKSYLKTKQPRCFPDGVTTGQEPSLLACLLSNYPKGA